MYFGGNNPSAFSVKASGAGVENLVNIFGQNYLSFDNLVFSGANGHAFALDQSSNLQLSNCDISFSGVNGINLTYNYASNFVVRNCTFTNTNNNAICAYDSRNWIIEHSV